MAQGSPVVVEWAQRRPSVAQTTWGMSPEWRFRCPASTRIDPVIRFWSKVDPCRTDGCAVWLAGLDSDGYGRFRVDGISLYAHHFLVGKAPPGLQWDHVKARGCEHRECVWPDHLEAVTSGENTRRGNAGLVWGAMQRAKTHCPQGHEYTPENTYLQSGRRRRCRTCNRAAALACYHRRQQRARSL